MFCTRNVCVCNGTTQYILNQKSKTSGTCYTLGLSVLLVKRMLCPCYHHFVETSPQMDLD